MAGILVLIGLVTGTVGGLFGIAGGTIIIPMLILLLGFSQVEAQGTSLVAMLLPIGLLGVLRYKKAGIFNYRASMIIALGIFLGAYPGAKLALALPLFWLKILFCCFLFYSALRFIDLKSLFVAIKTKHVNKREFSVREKNSAASEKNYSVRETNSADKEKNYSASEKISLDSKDATFASEKNFSVIKVGKIATPKRENRFFLFLQEHKNNFFILLFIGLLAGVASGLFGIGGGAIIVPLLSFALKFDSTEARVISLGALDPPVGLLGVIPYFKGGYVSLATSIPLAIAMMCGSFFGASLGVRVGKNLAKRLFGFFLLFVIGYFIFKMVSDYS